MYTWRLVATSGIISARSSSVKFFATPTGAVSYRNKMNGYEIISHGRLIMEILKQI